HAHWNASAFIKDRGGVRRLLERPVYSDRAIVPASHWLNATPPIRPFVSTENLEDGRIALRLVAQPDARFLAVQTLQDGTWHLALHDASLSTMVIPPCETFRVAAVSRTGELSAWWTPDTDGEAVTEAAVG